MGNRIGSTVRYGTVWYGNPIGNRIGANPVNTFYCLVISAMATFISIAQMQKCMFEVHVRRTTFLGRALGEHFLPDKTSSLSRSPFPNGPLRRHGLTGEGHGRTGYGCQCQGLPERDDEVRRQGGHDRMAELAGGTAEESGV